MKNPPPLDSELASLLYCDEVLDGAGNFLYLDSELSVSALDEDEVDAFYGIQQDLFDRKGDPQWLE